jgi:flagella basal body P-ring formation protein FlgA
MLAWGVAAVTVLAQTAATPPVCGRVDVVTAITASVAKMSGDVDGLAVRVLSCTVEPTAQIDRALPEPAARYGRPIKFRLMAQGRQAGYGLAIASGSIQQVRASRTVASGEALERADIATVVADASGLLVEPLPDAQTLLGRHAVRTVMPGETLTARIVRIPAAVQSGDRVVVRTRVGGVDVSVVGIAQQTGAVGDVIRLVNQDSRRPLRGRVTGTKEVEVVHGS